MAKQLLSTQASTGAEKQATAKAPCFKRPHDAFLDLRGLCLEKKMYKTCAFKNTIWGLTCLLYKQNQVFCLLAFFGFSDKVPLNQYWNFIIFRLGWLTATSESVQWPFARRTSGSHLDSSPTNHESKRATSPSIGYSPCAP